MQPIKFEIFGYANFTTEYKLVYVLRCRSTNSLHHSLNSLYYSLHSHDYSLNSLYYSLNSLHSHDNSLIVMPIVLHIKSAKFTTIK